MGGRTHAAAAAETLTLSARSDEIGRITLVVSDPGGAAVDVGERVGHATGRLRRIYLAGGAGELRRAARWRCDDRVRTFTATSIHADATVHTATASLTTPSCAHRLHMIVVPAQVRPGQATVVRVADSWHLGGLSARICARTRAALASCRTVRPPPRGNTLSRVRLGHAAPWTITLHTSEGQTVSRKVRTQAAARFRLLVTGDSMILNTPESVRYVLGARAFVRGDPHPATGISKPVLDWVAHAREFARSVRPDVTFVMVGANDGFPMTPAGGGTLTCCDEAWIGEYARRVAAMMTAYLRGGRGLVYWGLLPAPRSAALARVFDAVNAATVRAAARVGDGVTTIDRIAKIVAPGGVFHESIVYKGSRLVVREPDGIHLAPDGIHIARSTILRQLRSDGLLGRT